MRFPKLFLAATALISASATPALAWGELGHRTVGTIAYANVSPATAAQIDALIKEEAAVATPECKVKNIGDAATWPDCLRASSWRWAYTFPWHYHDSEVTGPAFDIKANCANGSCATAQIARTRRILADRSMPVGERLQALMFLVHIVGDLHQPLHAAEHAHDAGGNGVIVTNVPSPPYIINTVPPTLVDNKAKPANLHSVWDTVIVERAKTQGKLPAVRAYSAEEKAKLVSGDYPQWAQESWVIARDVTYAQAFGKVVHEGEATAREVTLTDAQLDTDATIASQRLLEAGLRLAKVLDETLSTSAKG